MGANGRANLWRELASPANLNAPGSEFWISLIYERTSTTGTDAFSIGSLQADVNLANGSYIDDGDPATQGYGLGFSMRGDNSVTATVFSEQATMNDNDTMLLLDASGGPDTVLLVGRVRLDIVGSADKMDLFMFRPGDAISLPLGAPAASVVGNGDNTAFNRINILGAQENGIDELRIANVGTGETTADAVAQVLPGLTIANLDLTEQLPTLQINRASGNITLGNAGSSALAIKGYSISAPDGGLLATRWTPLADSNSDWDASGTPALSETILTEVNTIGSTDVPIGAEISLGNAYFASPIEDVTASVTLADDSVVEVLVGYDGDPIAYGDFNADGSIDASDWALLRMNYGSGVGGVSDVAAYRRGNMDGSNTIDAQDIALFRDVYNSLNGTGAFAAMISSRPIPEPTTLCLLACGVLSMTWRRTLRRALPLLLATAGGVLWSVPASATLVIYEGFQYDETISNAAISLNGEDGTGVGEVDAIGLVGSYLTQNPDPVRQFQVSDAGSLVFGSLTTAGNHAVRGTEANFAPASRDIDPTILPSMTADGAEVWFSYILDPVDASSGQGNNGFALASTSLDAGTTNATIADPAAAGAGVRVGGTTGADAAFFGNGQQLDDGIFNLDAAAANFIIGRIRWGATAGDNDTVELFILTDATNIPGSINLDSPNSRITEVKDNTIIDTLTFHSNNEHRFDEFRVAVLDPGQTPNDLLAEVTPGLNIVIDTSEPLTLTVDPTTGTLAIVNNTGADIEMAGYEIRSPSGSLNPDGWSSLQDQDLAGFPAGDGSGNGWEELGIAGDYNRDGTVNLADYTVWRDSLGASVTKGAGADGNADGTIDAIDYQLWKSRLGASRRGLLAEAFLTGSSTLVNGSEPLSLGNAFSVSGTQDLEFRVLLADGSAIIGDVTTLPSGAISRASIPEPGSWLLMSLGLGALVLRRRTLL